MKKQITFQAQQSEEASVITHSVFVIVVCEHTLTKRRFEIEAPVAMQVFVMPLRTGDLSDTLIG